MLFQAENQIEPHSVLSMNEIWIRVSITLNKIILYQILDKVQFFFYLKTMGPWLILALKFFRIKLKKTFRTSHYDINAECQFFFLIFIINYM